MALSITTSTPYGEDVEKHRENTQVIDLRGLRSPQPVLVLADEAERIGPGETIGIFSDDPYSQGDFADWCATARMDIVEMKSLAPGVDRFVFRRPLLSSGPQPGLGHAA